MDKPIDEDRLALMKFGVGQPVPRKEDPTLLRGEGRYTDDIKPAGPGLRRDGPQPLCPRHDSDHRCRGCAGHAGRARHLYRNRPDRRRIWHDALRRRDPEPRRHADAPSGPHGHDDRPGALCRRSGCGRGRGNLRSGKDAAEAVNLEVEPLPAVTSASAAAAAGAPQLHEDVPNNVAVDFHYGDADKVAEAFAGAAHVTRLAPVNNRIVVCSMEPRAAIAQYDEAADHWTLHVGCQGVFGLRNLLKAVLGVPQEKIRVLTGNVGGSFA